MNALKFKTIGKGRRYCDKAIGTEPVSNTEKVLITLTWAGGFVGFIYGFNEGTKDYFKTQSTFDKVYIITGHAIMFAGMGGACGFFSPVIVPTLGLAYVYAKATEVKPTEE